MHTEDLVVDDDTKGQEVEEISEMVPDVGGAIFALAFSVEAV